MKMVMWRVGVEKQLWERALRKGPLLTLVMGPAWAWYSLNSFCRGRGYFTARMLPIEVPRNIMRPECEMTTAV